TRASDVEVVRLRVGVLVVDQVGEGVAENRCTHGRATIDRLLDAEVEAARLLGRERRVSDDETAPEVLEHRRLAERRAHAAVQSRFISDRDAAGSTPGEEVTEGLIVVVARTDRGRVWLRATRE